MWIAVRQHDNYYKLHRSPSDVWSVSKYDLAKDPTETNDIFDASDSADQAMVERINAYKEEMMEHAYKSEMGAMPRPKAIEMLRSLGYVD
jgi:hypothetical protein